MALPVEPVKIADRLGGRAVLKKSVRNIDQLQELISRGLPYESVDRVFAIFSDLDRARLSKAFGSRRSRQVLTPEASERLERLARTIALAFEAYGRDRDGAMSFLITPNRGLGNRAPFDIARTELGARMVEDLLLKIAYGFPS